MVNCLIDAVHKYIIKNMGTNTEQSSKGKGKTHKSTNRNNHLTIGKLGKRNGPDLVQAFPMKWWVKSKRFRGLRTSYPHLGSTMH
jgi:hypothetical protein